jgi:hypothetical protein
LFAASLACLLAQTAKPRASHTLLSRSQIARYAAVPTRCLYHREGGPLFCTSWRPKAPNGYRGNRRPWSAPRDFKAAASFKLGGGEKRRLRLPFVDGCQLTPGNWFVKAINSVLLSRYAPLRHSPAACSSALSSRLTINLPRRVQRAASQPR